MSQPVFIFTIVCFPKAACPQLQRPFGQNRRDDLYKDLAAQGHLYFIAIVVHSADHFLVDQLAVIVQLAKRFVAHGMLSLCACDV